MQETIQVGRRMIELQVQDPGRIEDDLADTNYQGQAVSKSAEKAAAPASSEKLAPSIQA